MKIAYVERLSLGVRNTGIPVWEWHPMRREWFRTYSYLDLEHSTYIITWEDRTVMRLTAWYPDFPVPEVGMKRVSYEKEVRRFFRSLEKSP